MVKFIIGLLVGGFFGMTYMCLACIVDDLDEFDEFMEEPEEPIEEEPEEPEEEEELRCNFCGGLLSGVMYTIDGIPYRHCYGCHFDYEVEE